MLGSSYSGVILEGMPHDPNQPSFPGIWVSTEAQIWTPYREGTIPDENPIRLNDTNQVVVRFWRDGKSVVDFTIHQQLRYLGEWNDVVRVDCSHGEVHYHLLDKMGNELKRDVIREIRGVGDVSQGYGIAHDWMWHAYDENTRRWHRGQ